MIADLTLLLAAGINTSSVVSETGILLLAKFPNVQDSIYNELFNVFNNNNNNELQFSLLRINQCPKLKAFINETLHITCTAPDGLGRVCPKNIRCVKYCVINKYNNNNSNNENGNNSDIICDSEDVSICV